MKIMSNDAYNKLQREIEARDDLINTQKEMINNLKESNDALQKMVEVTEGINKNNAEIIKLYKEQAEIMTTEIEGLKKALANNRSNNNNHNHHKKHNNRHKNTNNRNNNGNNDVKE